VTDAPRFSLFMVPDVWIDAEMVRLGAAGPTGTGKVRCDLVVAVPDDFWDAWRRGVPAEG
jgi:hypothetical protein